MHAWLHFEIFVWQEEEPEVEEPEAKEPRTKDLYKTSRQQDMMDCGETSSQFSAESHGSVMEAMVQREEQTVPGDLGLGVGLG